jgi:hypothetical protein
MKPSKACIRSLTRKTHLRLKEGVSTYLDNRKWLFNRLENDTVYLIDESGVFGMAVKIDNIEWTDVCL